MTRMAARSTATTKDAGPFDLFIGGLPRKFKWQDLKDLVRQHASHGLHTEIFNQFDAAGRSQGEVRVLRREEAVKLYRYLIGTVLEGRHLNVHMFDLSHDRSSFIGCNCEPDEPCPVTAHLRATAPARPVMPAPLPYLSQPGLAPIQLAPALHARPMVAAPPAPYLAPTMQMIPPPHPEHLELAMSRLYLDDPRLRPAYAPVRAPLPPQPQQPSPYLASPLYLPNATGTLVNAARGVVKTEARGVFVSGLKYKATADEVAAHFSRVGRVIRVELHKDPRTKRSKGYATILYADVGTAARAIEVFDGMEFMGMVLKVRHDKETTAIAAAGFAPTGGEVGMGGGKGGRVKGPLIVNGSGAYAGRDRQDSPLAGDA